MGERKNIRDEISVLEYCDLTDNVLWRFFTWVGFWKRIEDL